MYNVKGIIQYVGDSFLVWLLLILLNIAVICGLFMCAGALLHIGWLWV